MADLVDIKPEDFDHLPKKDQVFVKRILYIKKVQEELSRICKQLPKFNWNEKETDGSLFGKELTNYATNNQLTNNRLWGLINVLGYNQAYWKNFFEIFIFNRKIISPPKELYNFLTSSEKVKKKFSKVRVEETEKKFKEILEMIDNDKHEEASKAIEKTRCLLLSNRKIIRAYRKLNSFIVEFSFDAKKKDLEQVFKLAEKYKKLSKTVPEYQESDRDKIDDYYIAAKLNREYKSTEEVRNWFIDRKVAKMKEEGLDSDAIEKAEFDDEGEFNSNLIAQWIHKGKKLGF
ncbi:MAG: hypothetical protein NTZ80_04440 [Patescibacteria group bacterium]|nr:hypothetical protein [Patescibacteria group bacterium]